MLVSPASPAGRPRRRVAYAASVAATASSGAAGAPEPVLPEGWLTTVRELVRAGIDVRADTVGGERFLDSIRSLGKEGRLIVLGFADGIASVAANRLLLKNVDVRGVAWGSLIEDEPSYPRQQWEDLLQWHAEGHIQPVDGTTYPLARARDALRALEDRRATGKITLSLRDGADQVATKDPAQDTDREAGAH